MDIIRQFEEMSGHLTNMAVLLVQYRKDLEKAGFTTTQAFILVRDYHTILLTAGNTDKK